MLSRNYIFINLAALLLSFSSCKKFVQVSPPITELVQTSVYSTNATASAAVTGIYLTMASNTIGGGSHGISALTGLSADELSLYPGSTDAVLNQTYSNSLVSSTIVYIWPSLYNCIYQANSAIEGIEGSSGLSSAMSAQLTGESEFIRAFCFFYLTNLYGDVPLETTANYKVNEILARTPKSQVYQQIISDLTNAQNLLSDNYVSPDGSESSERVRPNKFAALALLARAYLYEDNWDSAAMAATEVINSIQYTLESDLDSVFKAGNNEAIWQLEIPQNSALNTPDGEIFLVALLYLGGPSSGFPIYLSSSLANTFEAGDLRKTKWVDSTISGTMIYYFPYKYKLYYTPGVPPAEYPTILRLGEQYLIRAEAEANGAGNGIAAAISDLNIIRNRAGLSNYSGSSDQTSVINAILHERRVELFSEYGHRWLDLQRTGTIDSVMEPACTQKGGTWNADWQLYPVPLSDIQTDPKLVQNSGY
jgi:hypothetical protein